MSTHFSLFCPKNLGRKLKFLILALHDHVLYYVIVNSQSNRDNLTIALLQSVISGHMTIRHPISLAYLAYLEILKLYFSNKRQKNSIENDIRGQNIKVGVLLINIKVGVF